MFLFSLLIKQTYPTLHCPTNPFNQIKQAFMWMLWQNNIVKFFFLLSHFVRYLKACLPNEPSPSYFFLIFYLADLLGNGSDGWTVVHSICKMNWWGMMTYLWMSCSEVYMTQVHPNYPYWISLTNIELLSRTGAEFVSFCIGVDVNLSKLCPY